MDESSSIDDKLDYLKETKNLIKNAIIDKGQTITEETTFREYAGKINDISVTPNLQDKNINITSNGSRTITADDGYDGLDEVNLNVNVSSGQVIIPTRNDVEFYDYDGTLLYSYSKTDFLALSAMPANPTHIGLTMQGWNWTLANAKAWVTNHTRLIIGQMAITNDEKTRLYLTIPEEQKKIRLNIWFYDDSITTDTITIDWGDSNIDTITPEDSDVLTHTYANAGDYVVSFYITSNNGNKISFQRYYNSHSKIITNEAAQDSYSYEFYKYNSWINKIEFGNNIIVRGGSFSYLDNIQYINLPQDIVLNGSCFENSSINYVTIPNTITSLQNSLFYQSSKLFKVSIPKETISFGESGFNYCRNLSELIVPDNCVLNNYVFANMNSLTKIYFGDNVEPASYGTFDQDCYLREAYIPNNATTIGFINYRGMLALMSVTIPSGVSVIQDGAFYNCPAVLKYDFTAVSAIPILNGQDTFYNINTDCKIIVPDNLYNDWIVAPNWSAYANYIVKESDI